MAAEPGAGAWTFSRNDISGTSLTYANDLWVAMGADATTGYFAISTATDPAGTWTRKQDIAMSILSNRPRPAYHDGTWAFAYGPDIYYSTDDWATYTKFTPSFQGYTNVYGLQSLTYGDGTWVLCRNNDPTFGWELQYASSLTGTWTALAPETVGTYPLQVAYNGRRWVAAGLSSYNTPTLTSVFSTATSLTGTWSVPATNVTTNDLYTTYGPSYLAWEKSIGEWIATGEFGFYKTRWASSTAGAWNTVGVGPVVISQYALHQPWASGDGYIVALVNNSLGLAPRRIAYVEADSYGESVSMTTITDASLNTSSPSDDDSTLFSVAYGGGVFVLAGKPSTQSYYGVSVSAGGEDGAGWGLIL